MIIRCLSCDYHVPWTSCHTVRRSFFATVEKNRGSSLKNAFVEGVLLYGRRISVSSRGLHVLFSTRRFVIALTFARFAIFRAMCYSVALWIWRSIADNWIIRIHTFIRSFRTFTLPIWLQRIVFGWQNIRLRHFLGVWVNLFMYASSWILAILSQRLVA